MTIKFSIFLFFLCVSEIISSTHSLCIWRVGATWLVL